MTDPVEAVLAEACDGDGACHGCMGWCDRCGDVSRTCDASRCDVHRCQICNEVRIDCDQERDISYVCFVCAPREYPHRWPTFLVMDYAHRQLDANPRATDTFNDVETSIYMIAHGDDRVRNSPEFHPHVLASELGFFSRRLR